MDPSSLFLLHSFLFLFLLLFLLSFSCGQLVVNVRNSGGEIIQEAISANTTEETVKLEFRKPDGSLITQLIDFASEVQIFRMITMAEEEKGQRGDAYHVRLGERNCMEHGEGMAT